jgi:NAD+ kinase
MPHTMTSTKSTPAVKPIEAPPSHLPIRRVVVLHTSLLTGSLRLAQEIAAWLRAQGIGTALLSLEDSNLSQQLSDSDLAIALGGDGTMLRAGCLTAQHGGIPVLGVNLGNLGFLVEVQPDEWPEVLEHVLKGEYWLEQRMMLRVTLERDGTTIGIYDVLNEIVVGRGLTGQPVRVEAHIDGELLGAYIADGLIASTPTGSTAYALAAGGPILPPELKNILLIPVASHLSLNRPIVLHQGTSVALRVASTQQAALSADGGAPVMLLKDDWIHVRSSPYISRFVRVQPKSYFYRTLMARITRNPLNNPTAPKEP